MLHRRKARCYRVKYPMETTMTHAEMTKAIADGKAMRHAMVRSFFAGLFSAMPHGARA